MSPVSLRISLAAAIALAAATTNAEDAFETLPGTKPSTPTPAAPQPAPELTNFMKDLLGTWKCNSTFPAGAMGPGSPEIKSTAKVKFTKEAPLAGFFYRGEYSIPKSKVSPMSMNGVFYLGYEMGSRQVVTVGVDSMGTISMGMGPLSETTATWTGEGYMMGQKVKMRETITKTAPKQVSHSFEVDLGKGFTKMGDDVCKK
jgi:hypothetical protein